MSSTQSSQTRTQTIFDHWEKNSRLPNFASSHGPPSGASSLSIRPATETSKSNHPVCNYLTNSDSWSPENRRGADGQAACYKVAN
ncbi:hypothetical protein N7470_005134 [Penicillium chermesinum]|nr:hypothetical protein N7470_005134 [Penicillium chermesinum]